MQWGYSIVLMTIHLKVEDVVELKKLDKPNWYFYYSS